MVEEWSIHSKGFGKTPVRLLEDNRLNVYAKIIYTAISSFADKDGKCYPSEKAILARSGLGRSTFYKYKKQLSEQGYIASYQPRKKGEQFQSCQYTLLTNVYSEKFGKVPVILLEDNRLNVYAKILYATISTFADKDGKCYPTERTILARSGLVRNTFYKYKKDLIKYGYITSYRPKGKNEQFQSCQYTLLGNLEDKPFVTVNNNVEGKEEETHEKQETYVPHDRTRNVPHDRTRNVPHDHIRRETHNTDGNTIISSFMKKKPRTTTQDTNRLTDQYNRPYITDQALQPSLDNIYSEYEVIYDATVKYAKEVKNHELTEQEKIAIKKVIGQTKGKYDPKTYFDFKG